MIWKGISVKVNAVTEKQKGSCYYFSQWWMVINGGSNYVHNPGWNELSVWAGDSLYILSSTFAYILTKE